MDYFSNDTERYTLLLARLHPVVEVSALVRPRLLLVAFLTATDRILMGVLYHTQKNMVQSRLRFWSSAHPAFFRRTRWRRGSDQLWFDNWKQKIIAEFTALASRLEASTAFHLEFPADATDAEIRDLLLASPLAAIF